MVNGGQKKNSRGSEENARVLRLGYISLPPVYRKSASQTREVQIMQFTRIETAYCNITVFDRVDESNTEEFRIRHALHQLINQYQKNYGTYETTQLMDELTAYHSPRVVGVR